MAERFEQTNAFDHWISDRVGGGALGLGISTGPTNLIGGRKGAVPAALEKDGPAAAQRELHKLIDRFGRHNVAVELWDHGASLDSVRNDALVRLALQAGVEPVATNNVHYASVKDRRLATALAAVRGRKSLDELQGWLPAGAVAHGSEASALPMPGRSGRNGLPPSTGRRGWR